ncbi:MAG: nickel pincer cofactor biosynthesis protein LarB [Planctomycetota bacterium]
MPLSQNGSADASAEFATVDHDRAARCGHGEVIYAAGKLPHEVVAIARELLDRQASEGDAEPCVLATRCDPAQIEAVRDAFGVTWPVEVGERSGAVIVGTPGVRSVTPIPIVTAGTSDLNVAEEVEMTCRALGFTPWAINDVGVAGVHRVLNRVDELRSGNCVIVVAGMEGALPSVVGGLVDVPVIAVPTSVGYGASFGGLSALLGMLNSCASGVTVVNIDNGFGAAYAACQIERMVVRGRKLEAENAKSPT